MTEPLLRVGVDIDGVLGEGLRALSQWAKARGIDIDPEGVRPHDPAAAGGLTIGELFAEAYKEDAVVEGVEFVDGAAETMEGMLDPSYHRAPYDLPVCEVSIITARAPHAKKATARWLARMARENDWFARDWFARTGARQPTLHFCRENGGNARSKAEYGMDVMIDDHVGVIEACVGTGAVGIIFDRPWNRVPTLNVSRSARVYRAKGWSEVTEILNRVDALERHYRVRRPDDHERYEARKVAAVLSEPVDGDH